jgi:hypothetical protein
LVAISVRLLRRTAAVVFPGDRRVWAGAAIVAVPMASVIVFYCLHPREYYTGTNNVDPWTYVASARAGEPVCEPHLWIPADTARVRLTLRSRTLQRPGLKLVLRLGGRGIESSLGGALLSGTRSDAVFPIPELPDHPQEQPASLCVTAADKVSWSGAEASARRNPAPLTVGGRPVGRRFVAPHLAVWYLPRKGARRSYVARAGTILQRAVLFRPRLVGRGMYVLIVLLVLPGLALAAVRCLALAVAAKDGSGINQRRLALSLFAIAALNFSCWALITPPFQSPDEVDHFAYTQTLVERHAAPSRNPVSIFSPGRWSRAELLALNDMSFSTDRLLGETRPPWTSRQERHYRQEAARLHPSPSTGGGTETAATHGIVYYAALAPAYILASSSPLDQLTLMRLASVLIGAMTVVFAYLLARELAPGRLWLAVLAALLVAFQPMYGAISGAVNNDVGVNAGAAALVFLLIRIVRRGLTFRLGLLTGALALALPFLKATSYSLYPVAILVVVTVLWRQHSRADRQTWAGVVLGAVIGRGVLTGVERLFHPPVTSTGAVAAGGRFVEASVSEALAHPLDYLAYVWQIYLPRLSFMARHYETTGLPGFVIFVERGWGAFGWYEVLFPHWVYVTILVVMLAVVVLAVIAARREWEFVRGHPIELAVLSLIPTSVVAGFAAAFYTTGVHKGIPEYGRYVFPAIAPLAVLVVASIHAFGRRWVVFAGGVLLGGMLALSYASQLLTLTTFYA